MKNFEHIPLKEQNHEKPRFLCSHCKQEVLIQLVVKYPNGEHVAKPYPDKNGEVCFGSRKPVIKIDRREKEQ